MRRFCHGIMKMQLSKWHIDVRKYSDVPCLDIQIRDGVITYMTLATARMTMYVVRYRPPDLQRTPYGKVSFVKGCCP